MTVKELISQLKKMPQNLNVGIAAHDNYEEECAGWLDSLLEFNKEDFDIADVSEKQMFEDMPEKCVILRC